MSADDNDHEDLKPSSTPGYNPSPAKSPSEYAKLDENDESLARWKRSLGLTAASSENASGPKVTVLALELVSSTLPAGKTISLDLSEPTKVAAETKKNPVVIKEGVEYKFRVNHSIISGVRYIQVVKRAGMEQMLGSYGPSPNSEPYVKNFEPEESPSGMIARSGTYNVKSRVVDDDGEVYADWEWQFKLAKEW
ncbi:immunoglobulin E-set [Lentinula novae-zelandiae]|nr:immunoglobulin E-set [Lentinula novae-zelandiae]